MYLAHRTRCSHPRLPLRFILHLLVATLIVAPASGAPGFSAPFLASYVGQYPRSVAVGDLNGDLKPDVVTANGAGTVSVLLGNEDGTFGARADYAAGSQTYSVKLANLNPDGKLDLVYTEFSGVRVWLGNGDGTFGAATPITNFQPNGMAIEDLNGDSNPDLVTVGGTNVYVQEGNGQGGFAPWTGIGFPTGTTAAPIHLAIGNLNADARPDLVLANYGDRSISVMLQNANGTFGPATVYPVGSNPNSVAIGNLDGVGGLDLCVAMDSNPQPVAVLLGNGDGTFGEATLYGFGDRAYEAVIADFDQDGKVDLAVGSFPAGISVFHGNGDGTLGPQTDTWALVGYGAPVPGALAPADLNADGKLDLVSAGSLNFVCALLGNGDLTFGSHSRNPTTPGLWGPVPLELAIGDLNHDGHPDLSVANSVSRLSTLRGNGDGTFQASGIIDLFTASPTSVAIGDVNGDTHPDLVTIDKTLGPPSSGFILPGNGDGTFGAKTGLDAGRFPVSLAIGDLDGIGGPDLVFATHVMSGPNTVGVVRVLLGNGNGTFGPGTDYPAGTDPAGLAVSDLDGDGDLDVAIARNGSTAIAPVAVLLGNGNGTLGSAVAFGTGGPAQSVAVGDLDANSAKDLVLGSSNGLRVLLGNGNGTFGPQGDYDAGLSFASVVVGDVDGDGKSDVAAVSGFAGYDPASSIVTVLHGNGNGTLGTKVGYGAGRAPVFLAIGDLNGDGRPDLVTADRSDTTATVLINHSGPTTAVLLYRFEATWLGETIEVRWQFGPGSGLITATLQRGETANGPWVSVSDARLDEAGLAVVTDSDVIPGTLYFYRLLASAIDGGTMTFGPISTSGAALSGFQFVSIGPNPAPGRARIVFDTPNAAPVRVRVLDVQGRTVATLADLTLPAGHHEAVWEASAGGSRVPAGLYFVRFDWPEGAATRTLAVVR